MLEQSSVEHFFFLFGQWDVDMARVKWVKYIGNKFLVKPLENNTPMLDTSQYDLD